ncbi:MAG: peptidase E [Pseudomonadales bacterium]|jgi:dipeptidase E|nr:peptidase E [Pseudomonadales bacterium]
MRLFLASQDFGKHVDRLRELVGDNKRTLFIINARDERDSDYRQDKTLEKKRLLESGGFEWLGELDLRKYFGKKDELRKYLADQKIGHIHVSGGNTYLLRKAFALSGFDEIIKEMLMSDELVYSGSSAGSMVLTPDLNHYFQDDRSKIKAAGYPDEIIWDGLGLVDEYISPHHSNEGHEDVSRERKEAFEKSGAPYILLDDSDVLVIDGEKKEVLR